MNSCLGEKEALIELEKGYDEAKEVLNNSDKMERFLQRLERKLKIIPLAGEILAAVPVMASLIKSYVKKEYTDVPIGTIVAVISALTYVISPIDLIPDSIPVLGYFDDAAVVAACWKLVESDIEEYTQWREKNNKVLDV